MNITFKIWSNLIILSCCFVFSCTNPNAPETLYEHPSIREPFIMKYGDPMSYAWVGDRFYVNPAVQVGITKYEGDRVIVLKDTSIGINLPHYSQITDSAHRGYWGDLPYYITAGKDTNSLLFTSSFLSPVNGGMGELDIPSLTLTFYLDSSYAVSTCLYMPNSTRYIYFYTFGSPHLSAGYYLYDKQTKQSNLIFNYASDIRYSRYSGEYIHGFDISPDGKKLLYPVSMKGDYPLMVEYDLASGTRDTIDIVFERKQEQQCMWLRYSPDGKKILYCCYPEYAYDHAGHYPETNELGVYDKEKKRKIIIPVSTNTKWGSISIYPVWSSNGKHLLYGSGKCSTDGMIGIFFPYIFENVEGYLATH